MWVELILLSLGEGASLAMDAFSVSLANGLNEPRLKKRRIFEIAGIFAAFQFLMPMIGWFCVSTLTDIFTVFERFIPWIALGLLGFIGGKMLYEGVKNSESDEEKPAVGLWALIVQGIATSIDALSVGFTISEYGFFEALISCAIIGVVTFFICAAGVVIGKKFGMGLAGKASILGGAILIVIGIWIFVKGVFLG
ncbi:MAG: manganese efflux pump [Clostridia bacterium]|nr:manganese efflux pump [Clostridia bacterium]